MTKCTPYALFVFLLFAAAQAAFPQTAATPEVGASPYKSYSGGDIDHIQMQNGSLYLRIPLLSYPQLGKLKLSFSLLANSTQFQEMATCDSTGDCGYWWTFSTPAGGCLSPSGYPHNSVSNIDGQSNAWIVVDQDTALTYCSLDPTEYSFYYVGNGATISGQDYFTLYELVDSSDAVHPLGNNESNWSSMQTTDGSGYTVQMPWANTLSAAANAELGVCPSSLVITDSSGVKQTSTCSSQGTYSTTISDPAGNSIQRSITDNYWGSNSTPITDSVGRQIPDPTTIPVDPNPAAVCPNLGITGEPVAYSLSWTVPGYQGNPSTYHFCYTTVNIGTNFFEGGVGQTSVGLSNCYQDDDGDTICSTYSTSDMAGTVNVLQSVVLPNNTYWGFVYDTASTANPVSFGDLLRVILPSGGSLNYTYNTIPVCGIVSGEEMPPVGRAVASRTLNPIVGQPVTTTYEYSETPRAGAMAQTIETDAYGNDTVHKFTLDYPYGPNVCGAEETATQWYQGSSNGGTSGTVLKEVDTSYTYEMNPQDDVTDTWRSHINVLPQTQTAYLNGQVESSVSYNYDTLFTASQAYQDFGPGNPQVMPTTSPIRYEVPTYVNDGIGQTVTTREATVNSAYQAAGFVALPQSVTQYDENWNQIATTTYAYDEPTCSPSGTFGNLTSITRDYGTKTSWCYDTQAMQTSTTNPNGNAWGGNGTTSYTYDSSGLYITKVQEPSTNGTAHIRYYKQDPTTGWTTGISDYNASSISDTAHTIYYNNYDQIGRLTQVNYPDGGQITQCFTDEGGATCSLSGPPYSVVTRKLQSASVWQQSSVTYDGLGRSLFAEAPNASYTATAYDVAGNLCAQSNPSFTAPPSSGLSCTPGQNQAPASSWSRPRARSKQTSASAWRLPIRSAAPLFWSAETNVGSTFNA